MIKEIDGQLYECTPIKTNDVVMHLGVVCGDFDLSVILDKSGITDILYVKFGDEIWDNKYWLKHTFLALNGEHIICEDHINNENLSEEQKLDLLNCLQVATDKGWL